MTWYSMNAVDKWKIVDEAKAGLENLRQMAAIEESLQQQRAQRAAERNKAALRARYASIGPGGSSSGSTGDDAGTGSCSSAVAQRFSFGRRSGGSGGADDDAEKRRSLLVGAGGAAESASATAPDDDDDVLYDDASSQCLTPQRTPRSPLATTPPSSSSSSQ